MRKAPVARGFRKSVSVSTPPIQSISYFQISSFRVLGACGIPPSLVGKDTSTATREAFRIFVFSRILPLAKKVSHELGMKLNEPGLSLDFADLAAADIAGRARSYKALIESDMPASHAAAIVGFPPDPGDNANVN